MNFITYAAMVVVIAIAGTSVVLMGAPSEEESEESIFGDDDYYGDSDYYSSKPSEKVVEEPKKALAVEPPKPKSEPVRLTKVREFGTKQEARSFAEGIEFVNETWKVSDIKYDYKKDKFVVEITY